MNENTIIFKKPLVGGTKVLNHNEMAAISDIYELLQDKNIKGSKVLSDIRSKMDEIINGYEINDYRTFYQEQCEAFIEKLKPMYGKFYHVTTKNLFPCDLEFLLMPYKCVNKDKIAGIKINLSNTEYSNKTEDTTIPLLQDILYNDETEYIFEEITEEEFRQTAIDNANTCLDMRLKKMYERDTLTDIGYVNNIKYTVKEN